MTSTALVAGARQPSPPQPRLPAETGVWMFIFGDLFFFAYLFILYLHSGHRDRALFAHAQHELDVGLGVFYTLLLLTSSLLLATALNAIRAGDAERAPRLVAATMACGVVFAVTKGLEYHAKASQSITPNTNSFFLFYFILTGAHLFHLLIGLGLLTFLLALSRRAGTLTPLRTKLAEGCACFWHMVDMLWIVIFPLVYLVH